MSKAITSDLTGEPIEPGCHYLIVSDGFVETPRGQLIAPSMHTGIPMGGDFKNVAEVAEWALGEVLKYQGENRARGIVEKLMPSATAATRDDPLPQDDLVVDASMYFDNARKAVSDEGVFSPDQCAHLQDMLTHLEYGIRSAIITYEKSQGEG